MATRLRRAEQVERNHESVLAAARRVFLERGYAGASLDAIAEEAGFSKGVVYSQFGSKADLFLALLERRVEERAAQNEQIVARLAGTEAFHKFLRAAERDAVTEAGWARLLVEFRAHASREPELNTRYAEVHGRTVNRLTSALAQLHAQAGLQPTVSLRSMAELILVFGAGIALERAANPTALPGDDITLMLTRALGLPDQQSLQAGKKR